MPEIFLMYRRCLKLSRNIIEEIEQIGIVPVVVIEDVENAVGLAKALMNGGLPCAEVTFRTKAAAESIRLIKEAYPEMILGAGTILTVEQAKSAIEAGAEFIVSPGINPEVVSYCINEDVCIIPGCANPTNIETALSLGVTNVKFFPAEQAGGLAMMQAMSAPYSNVRFMPTGGINEKNIKQYLGFSKVIACGGSYMVSKDLIANKAFDKITELTKRAVQAMLDFRVVSVGTIDNVQTIVMASGNLKRAVYHLNKMGVFMEQATAIYKGDRLTSIDMVGNENQKIRLIEQA